MRRRKPALPATEPGLGPAKAKVMAEYIGFLETSPIEEGADPKSFGARHAAAKTALSHLEQLMKLSGDGQDEASRKRDDYQALLGEMRQDISAEPEGMPSDDDGDPG